MIITEAGDYLLEAPNQPGKLPAGIYNIAVQGFTSGVQLNLQWSLDGATWHDNNASTTNFTADGTDTFYISEGIVLRVHVTGATPALLLVVSQAIARK